MCSVTEKHTLIYIIHLERTKISQNFIHTWTATTNSSAADSSAPSRPISQADSIMRPKMSDMSGKKSSCEL